MRDMADTDNQPQEDKSLPRNVSMYAEQWAVVDEINDALGFRNVSIALRYIVTEYSRMKARQPYTVADPA